MEQEVADAQAMITLGTHIGALCAGGEVIELIGDIGAGKTTLTKGLAMGMGIDEDIQSPTFTISRVYTSESGLVLAHYDFYRLQDPGIMSAELRESVNDPKTVTVIEWGGVVAGVLPSDTLRLRINSLLDDGRSVTMTAGGPRSRRILEEMS